MCEADMVATLTFKIHELSKKLGGKLIRNQSQETMVDVELEGHPERVEHVNLAETFTKS